MCFNIFVKVVLSLGDYMGASCYACVGGNNMKTEIQRLQAEPQQIIVGTPGRVFDMITRKVSNTLTHTKIRRFQCEFISKIKIFFSGYRPPRHQNLCFGRS